jgi:hypothetical protein
MPWASADGLQRRHVRGVPIEVHRHDAHGAVGDRRLDRRGIEAEAVGLDVGEDRRGAGERHRVRRRGERERRDDHLIARADAGGQQAEVQARGAGVDGDAGPPEPKCAENSSSKALTSGPWASIPLRSTRVDRLAPRRR